MYTYGHSPLLQLQVFYTSGFKAMFREMHHQFPHRLPLSGKKPHIHSRGICPLELGLQTVLPRFRQRHLLADLIPEMSRTFHPQRVERRRRIRIHELREKLGDHPSWQLTTVWGVGYKFEVKQ